MRFKLAVTEDRPTVGTYDERAWAELPDARSGPVEGSLAILDGLHLRWVAFLRALAPNDFARVVRHPDWGEITVDTLLEIGERRYRLIDTAGIRRAGRIERGPERMSVQRARRNLEHADVAVLVLDAGAGLEIGRAHV